jgi:hypothetical protein
MNTPKIDATLQSNPKTQRSVEKFHNGVAMLEKGLAEQKMWNTEYETAKYWINQGAEYALSEAAEPWRELYRQGKRDHYKEGDPRWNIGYSTSPLHATSYYNKLKKYQSQPEVASYMEVLAEVGQVGEMMKKIKPFIVKGRKPAPPKPDPWAGIPRADEKQLGAAKQVFENLCQQMKAQALEQHIAFYTSIVMTLEPEKVYKVQSDEFYTLFGGAKKNRYGYTAIPPRARIAMDFMEGANYPENHDMYPGLHQGEKMATDWEARVQKRSTEEVEAMFAAFITKQTEKVAAIIKNRAAQVTGEIAGTLECTLNFVLSDKSKFEMRCKIVWHVNQQGTQYWQFPTTFHNAVKADGTRITPASELNMKKLF